MSQDRGEGMSASVAASTKALDEILHAERHKADSRNVDCWVCEAIKSPAIQALIEAHAREKAAASHANAVIARAVPDEEQRLGLWRDHWRDVLAGLHDLPGAPEVSR